MLLASRRPMRRRALQSPLVSSAKKPCIALSQEHYVRVKWKVRAGAGRAIDATWDALGGVVVEDHMHGFAGRNLRLDGAEDAMNS